VAGRVTLELLNVFATQWGVGDVKPGAAEDLPVS
jgi:hypothetical protein